jgi:hypothetical protein
MCGWNNSIAYRGDDQNTEFDALQVNLAQAMKNGLTINANYEWASAFDEESGYYTWSHSITHGRDSNVRDQQLTMYGSYDFPFGKGKQFLPGANHATDLLVGGWQLSDVTQWSGGLPFTLSYNECGSNINGGPGYPTQSKKMQPVSRPTSPTGQAPDRALLQPAHSPLRGRYFTNPGLDNFGNAGINTYRGPDFFGPTSD